MIPQLGQKTLSREKSQWAFPSSQRFSQQCWPNAVVPNVTTLS